ncbi:MAG: ATP-binding cassette domain-containing protein [Patescibacteria group bacterium]|jgi:ABC-2 type transport system ATP-binding protein
MTESNILEVDGLTRTFGDFTAVDHISFSVGEGEVFGFLGPNGAGKTTTINMLATILRATEGDARIDGHSIKNDRIAVRRAIGLVFQDSTLDLELKAYENLRFHAEFYGVTKPEYEERSKELLKIVELADRANDYVRNFSGGMKRRLEIARGLLHHPRLLFLDEPTIGLDPQTRSVIWQYILKVAHEQDITLFLTTHYLAEAEYCNRIAIIDHGKIIALDTPKNLKRQVGGDIITLTTEDNQKAQEGILATFKLQAEAKEGKLIIVAQNGEELLPKMIRDLPVKVTSVALREPTMDDVFLKFTGREIREDEASNKEKTKAFMQRRGFRR